MADVARSDLQVAVSDAITSAVLLADCDRAAGRVRVDAQARPGELVVRVRESGRQDSTVRSCPSLGPRLSMIAALAQGVGVRRCEGGASELSMRCALGRG